MFSTKNISESHVIRFLKEKDSKTKEKITDSKKTRNVSFEKSVK
jgi:hypothetical protein